MLKSLFIIGFALSSSILPISAKKGVSILFTSDDVQSAVDKLTSRDDYVYNSICDAENRDLSSLLYEYLTEKFPHMHFLVGIGNSRLDDGHPTSSLSLLKRDQLRVFEGGFKGSKQIEYYDGYYANQKKECNRWYFVRVMDSVNHHLNNAELAKNFTECLHAHAQECIGPEKIPCEPNFVAIVDKRTKPGLYTSESVATNAALLTVLDSMAVCEDKESKCSELKRNNLLGILSAV